VAESKREAPEWGKAMGKRLQELRLSKELSQTQLAKLAGVPVGSLRSWEYGRREPLLSTAARLAIALGVSLDELAGIGPAAVEKKGTGKKDK
jgi:transcriptional regulator with XRE-family HTH domain